MAWRCRKNFSQWECSFHWKLRCHWLEFLRQRQIAVVRQDPGLWKSDFILLWLESILSPILNLWRHLITLQWWCYLRQLLDHSVLVTIITMTSHERHGVTNDRQLECLLVMTLMLHHSDDSHRQDRGKAASIQAVITGTTLLVPVIRSWVISRTQWVLFKSGHTPYMLIEVWIITFLSTPWEIIASPRGRYPIQWYKNQNFITF